MYIIAEIGQAHEGSLGLAHSYIDALADTGVDAIKFQMHIADAESSMYEPFRVKFSYEDNNRYDYWKRMEFSKEQWAGLKKHCEDVSVDFLVSPFSLEAIDILDSIGVNQYKIGSGEVSNLLMLRKLAFLNKSVILSSGLSTIEELDRAVGIFKMSTSNISLLHCTSEYPTKPESWGLNMIQFLKDRYNIIVGFSDHSGDIYAPLAAVALGAELLECHVVFNKRMFGPDTLSSVTIDDMKRIVIGAKQIKFSLMNKVDKVNISESTISMKKIFEKSLAVNQKMLKGECITLGCLETKKPKGYGIDASLYESVIGKRLTKDLPKWSFLNYDDLED